MASLQKELKMPKLRKYFEDELPKLKTKTGVWDAFIKWSGHQLGGKPSADEAKKAALQIIAANKAHWVGFLETITNDPNSANTERSANGIFYPKKPDTIYMKMAIANFYDENIDSKVQDHRDLAVKLVESTCLHEFVHLLNYKHHKKVRGFVNGDGTAIGEMGKEFEKEAYGKDIGNEGWMRLAAISGAAIPASVAAKMQVYEGKIARVDINVPALVVTNSAGKNLVHKLAPKAQVTIDGKAKTLADLKTGQQVRVTPVRVEALDKSQKFPK